MTAVSQTATHPNSPLLALAAGPTRVLQTSASLAWQGVLLEEHRSDPGARVSTSIHCHVISMTVGCSSLFEHRTNSGPLSTCLHRPGMLMVTPAGPMPELRSLTAADFVHCALDKTFTEKVSEEMDRPARSAPAFRLGLRDTSIERLLSLLREELMTPLHLGRLYVDSLAHALAYRFLLLNGPVARPAKSQVSALPTPVLKRLKEKMEANIDGDLSLDRLAEETGYSRAHFLRMFHTATGATPHQYVLNLRLKRAQERLLQKGSSIIDVALSCGFSSQAHMTNLFRRHLSITPAQYRRNA